MTITKQQVIYLLIGLVLLIALGSIITLVRISKNRNAAIEKVKMLDDQLTGVKRERDAYLMLNAEKDKDIAESKRRDSMYLQAIINRQPKYTENEKKYNDIPKRINDLDHDALIREITNY